MVCCPSDSVIRVVPKDGPTAIYGKRLKLELWRQTGPLFSQEEVREEEMENIEARQLTRLASERITSLSRTCRRLYTLFKDMPHVQNHFHFTSWTVLKRHLFQIGERRKALRKITLDIVVWDQSWLVNSKLNTELQKCSNLSYLGIRLPHKTFEFDTRLEWSKSAENLSYQIFAWSGLGIALRTLCRKAESKIVIQCAGISEHGSGDECSPCSLKENPYAVVKTSISHHRELL